MAKPGPHTAATFAEASPAERAKLLGVSNVVMAGFGLPDDDRKAEELTAQVADSRRIVWEIMPEGKDSDRPFDYGKSIHRVRALADRYPQIEGVLLDDMSTVKIDRGFKPQHIRQVRELLGDLHARIKVWGVLYTMSFDRPNMNDYIRELDVINLWTWHAKDIPNLARNVEYCERTFPGKPIVLGLYLYDYGENRRMPRELLERQCATALELACAGRIQGIVFLTITNDTEVVTWTADWIKRVGDRKLTMPASRPEQTGPIPGSRLPGGGPRSLMGLSRQTTRIGETTNMIGQTILLALLASEAAETGARNTQPAPTPDTSKADVLHLKIGEGAGWSFLGGPWTEDKDGIIRPPDRRNLHSRAFCKARAFKDLTAEFEFNGNYRETGTGSAGLILRAADAHHFYFVWFPWGGQQLRAKHFWAAVAKVEGDGYLRNIKAAWVPGVPSETDRWYNVRVTAEGPTIRVWVDGRRALDVIDSSYSSGYVGLAGYGWYMFRTIRISGREVPPPTWKDPTEIPTHAFTVGLTSENMPSGCVAPNGDVLLAAGNTLVRSTDKGRTWGKAEPLPDKLGTVTDYGNTMFRTPTGRLIVMLYRPQADIQKPAPEILIAESPDNGRTWSDPVPSQVAPNWPAQPKNLVPYGPLVATQDETLLRFLLGGVKEENDTFTDVRTWSAIHCKAFVIRSTDGGKSWSAPIEIDRPSWCDTPRGKIPGSLDLTEPTGVAIGNVVTVLVRPVYSPTMWQCWSHNAGATWDAAARATFPGYAQSMVRTRSGAILCAHRYPHYSVNISTDGGLNWDEGTVVDYPVWAMGCMIEVEPDTVLCTYMNAERNQPLLAQRIRVGRDRIAPLLQ